MLVSSIAKLTAVKTNNYKTQNTFNGDKNTQIMQNKNNTADDMPKNSNMAEHGKNLNVLA